MSKLQFCRLRSVYVNCVLLYVRIEVVVIQSIYMCDLFIGQVFDFAEEKNSPVSERTSRDQDSS